MGAEMSVPSILFGKFHNTYTGQLLTFTLMLARSKG